MRILTFLHSFEPGGVERVALRLIRHWRSMGIDAPLFVGREDGALRSGFADGLSYHVPVQPRIGTAAWETLWMIARLPAEINRTRPDILFVSGSTYTVVAVAMALRFGKRCPAIVVKISNDLAREDLPQPLRLGWRLWLRVQARFARIWVIMDEAIAAELPRAMASRSWVIHDPAISETQILDAVPDRAPGPHRFVAIGRLVAQKDYPLMLRAFARGANKDETLTIFGDGPARSTLEALADALGLAGRVRFEGHIADASARLRDYDTLLLSSRYEGIPAVLVEALAAGLSVIATDSGVGVRSLLGNGHFGQLVPRDEAALAIAIGQMPITTSGSAQPLREEHVRRFTIERSAMTYLAAFECAGRLEKLPPSLQSSTESTACPVPPAR